MSGKPSRLLLNAKELIKNQNLNDAMLICEEVLNIDPNNINGLLLATKCWMDLDIKYENVKCSLEKILILKPNNPTAIQGLRKFYEKHSSLYFDDAFKFYQNLYNLNELMDKDFEIISTMLNKPTISAGVERFVCDCLILRIKDHKDVNCLKIFFQLAAKYFITMKDRNLFDQFVELIAKFDNCDNISSDGTEIDYLKSMETLFRAYIDNMEPEYFFTLLDKNNIKNVYGYALFAEILCDHYLFSDCNDTLELAFSELESDNDKTNNNIYQTLKCLHIKNIIQSTDRDELNCYLSKNSTNEYIAKYLWCQAFGIGCDVFSDTGLKWEDVSSEWCQQMNEQQVIIASSIMTAQQCPLILRNNHEKLLSNDLTSFEWYLWANVLKQHNVPDLQQQALNRGLKTSKVHFKIHDNLGDIYCIKSEYKLSVEHYWHALELQNCPIILEKLIDLHINNKQYEQPIEILDKLEIENCSESLLRKFVSCLNYLDRITDAISIAQRLVKQFFNNGNNWQLLGDLYLKRGNINSAYTTYCRTLELNTKTNDIFVRLGNVFSLKYQETLNENDFSDSIMYFNKSMDICPSVECVEGLTSVLYLHAEISLKQLMLSCVVSDIQKTLQLLIDFNDLLKNTQFQMNLLGKTIFMSINGSVDNILDFSPVLSFLSMSSNDMINPLEIAFNCFKKSIQKFPTDPEAYFNSGMLGMYKLNRQCVGNERGNILFPNLYSETENYFKTALYFDSSNNDAWKYLGLLYFRHGIVTGKYVFDIQHCLSTAINLTSTADCLKDIESTFLLGLLYTRENWCYLSKELFEKLQMDYPVNPIGYIGMYLLAAQDHTVAEQSHIAKAILCYNYRDEESSLDDSCYRINDSVVGLFCDNLGFLVNSRCDYESFDSPESSSVLIEALKTTLNNSWIKYRAYQSIGCSISSIKQKQYSEYGCFLGVLEMLTGNCQWGKRLIDKSIVGTEDPFFLKLSEIKNLDDSWINNDKAACVDLIQRLAKHANLKLKLDSPDNISMENNDPSQPTKIMDQLLLTSIIHYLTPSSHNELLANLQLLISKLPSLSGNDNLTLTMQTSIMMSLGALISSTNKQQLASQFIEAVNKYFPTLDDDMDNFSRILCRLKAIETSPKHAFKYMHNHCLKQPNDMNRWLNLLEIGLEYYNELADFVNISQIFFITNRPWCLTPFDIERYANILKTYSVCLTNECLSHQKHMIMRAMRLYPHLCLDYFRTLIYI